MTATRNPSALYVLSALLLAVSILIWTHPVHSTADSTPAPGSTASTGMGDCALIVGPARDYCLHPDGDAR